MTTTPEETIPEDTTSTALTDPSGAQAVEEAAPPGFVHRLLFEPESAWPIAIARIILGLALLGWAVSFMFDVTELLAPGGLMPIELALDEWRVVSLASERSVWIALIAIAISAVFVIVGFRPAPFLVLSFFLLVAIQRRNPWVVNSGDFIFTNLLFLLALTPSSAALSVDRWRKHGRSSLRSAPQIAPVGMRLIQLQMMLAYFFAAWPKSGADWVDGTAVAVSLQLRDLQRFAAPEFITGNVPLITLMTWGALALELMLAMFLWNRRMRPFLIAGGIALHLFIDGFLLVGFFGPAMIAGLLTFMDGDMIQRRLDGWFSRRSLTAS